MGLNKVNNTYHGNDRSRERTELTKKQRDRLIKEASRYGKTWQNLLPGPLQTFVRFKTRNKRTKYFQGYIFVFQKTSTSLITMYPVPVSVLDKQKLYNIAEEEKRNQEDGNE